MRDEGANQRLEATGLQTGQRGRGSSCPCGHLAGSPSLLGPFPSWPSEAASVGCLPGSCRCGQELHGQRAENISSSQSLRCSWTLQPDSGRDLKAGTFGHRAPRFKRNPDTSESLGQRVTEVLMEGQAGCLRAEGRCRRGGGGVGTGHGKVWLHFFPAM